MPLKWLLLASFSLGILRTLTVPLGDNIDEEFHMHAIWQVKVMVQVCLSQPSTCNFAGLVNGQWGGGNAVDMLRGLAYYNPIALGLALLPVTLSETAQYLLTRGISILFYLGALTCAYHSIAWLFPKQQNLATLCISTLALIPSFGDFMSGVNLEVSVAAASALGILTLTHFLTSKFKPINFLWIFLATIGCYLTKGTAWVTILVIIVILAFFLPAKIKWGISGLSIFSIAMYFLLFFPKSTPQVSFWYYLGVANSPVEISPQSYSFSSAINTSSSKAGHQFDSITHEKQVTIAAVQYLPETSLPSFLGKTVTCGVWVRTLTNTETIPLPTCGPTAKIFTRSSKDNLYKTLPNIKIIPTWTFISQQYQLEPTLTGLGFFLGLPENTNPILYDGMVFVIGAAPTQKIPIFLERTGKQVLWGGIIYQNFVRNATGTNTWHLTAPTQGLPYLVNSRLVAVLDWQRTWTAWINLSRWMFTNFWSSFSGVRPGLNSRQIATIAFATLLSSLGNLLILFYDLPQHRPPYHTRSARLGYVMLILLACLSLGLIIYRADLVPFSENMLIWSSMRHATAGYMSFAALLGLGWWRLCPPKWQPFLSATIILTLYLINIYILLKIQLPFYHCPSRDLALCLPSLW